MSEPVPVVSLLTVESSEEDNSYNGLKELYMNAVAAWSKCADEAVIENRLLLLWIAHLAFRNETSTSTTAERFRLDYSDDFVKPLPSDEVFTEEEIRLLYLFFDYSIGSLVKPGMKDGPRLVNKLATAEEVSCIRNILMLPSAAGIIKPICRSRRCTYEGYQKRPMQILCAVLRIISHHQTTTPPASPNALPLPVSSVSEKDDTMTLSTPIDTKSTQEQIEARCVDDLSMDIVPPPEQVLAFDEVVEGHIIALNPPALGQQDDITCVIAWEDSTTENVSIAAAVDAIEVHQSLDRWTMNHSSVGTHIAKHFDGDLYYGQVVLFALEDDGNHLYHVEWSDGDEEDLDWEEFRMATSLYHRQASNHMIIKQVTKTCKRKYIFIDGQLLVKVGMKVARLSPIALHNKMPAPGKSFPDILAQSVYISKKTVSVELEESMITKHPSLDKKVCRVLSLRNHVNKAVHFKHLLQGIITGYIPASAREGGSVELYRVKWDDIEEQQWLNYTEIAKCTPLKSEKKHLMDWMSAPLKTKRRRLTKPAAVAVEQEKPEDVVMML